MKWFIRLVIFVAGVLLADACFHFSTAGFYCFAIVFYIFLFLAESMISAYRQERLNKLAAEQGIYSDAYLKQMLKVMKKEGKDKRTPFCISLSAVYIARGEFDKAQEAVEALPVDWPKRASEKLFDMELMRMRTALYFNNAITCFYYMENVDKADYYYNAGKGYIEDYLKNGKNRNMKAAIKDTLACYYALHGEDDRALQLLDEIEYTNNLENFCSGTILRAKIYMKQGNWKKAKVLLETIEGKNENPMLNREAKEMLQSISDKLSDNSMSAGENTM